MKKLTWKETAEIGGLVAILIGLYFVYTEIRQNSVIARAEMSGFAKMRIEYVNGQFSDPAFRELYIKGVRSPAELNESERLRLHAFFEDVYGVMIYEFHNYRLGIFMEYESYTRFLAGRFFMRGFGRAWWNVQKIKGSIEAFPEIVDVVDQELMNMDRSGDWIWLDEKLQGEIESL